MAFGSSKRSSGKGTPSVKKGSPATTKGPSTLPSRAPVATPQVHAAKGLATVESKSITHDQIAQAAYFRWLEKGGDQRANWLEAEAELRAKAALGMA